MTRVTVSTRQDLQVEIQAGPHTLIADEPPDLGGGATGPDPYSLLLAALGA
jgi:putative redox protein